MGENVLSTVLFGLNAEQLETCLLIGMPMLAAVCFVLFLLFGRDENTKPVPMRDSPMGITPAELGFAVDGYADDSDLLSLIPYWAEKGYLKITGGETMRLVKKQDPGFDAKPFEKHFFEQVFLGNKTVEPLDLRYKFWPALKHARRMLARSHAIGENRVFTRTSMLLKRVFALFTALPVYLTLTLALNRSMGGAAPAIVAAAIVGSTVLTPVFCIIRLMRCWPWRSRRARHASLAFWLTVLALFIIGFFVYTLGGTSPLLPVCAVICTAAIGLCAVFITKRSPYGAELLGMAEGLRQYLASTGPDSLPGSSGSMMRLLPYAYALGKMQEWAEKCGLYPMQFPAWFASRHNEHIQAEEFAQEISMILETYKVYMQVEVPPRI
jgi:hypothetical protein